MLPEGLPTLKNKTKAEMLNVLLKEEYGSIPSSPRNIKAIKTNDAGNFFCAGKATLTHYSMITEGEEFDFAFPFRFICPTGADETTPVPCFIFISFEPEIPNRFLPIEEIIDNGFAVLTFCYKEVTTDDDDFANGLAGAVYPNGRKSPEDCGKIGLWAWAALRLLDYAQTLPQIKKDRISVVGHSRLGKTALLAGALDERFYCAFSNDSGCSGAALSREKDGETIEFINKTFPYWFCENYKKYSGKENEMPFDQHYLIASNYPHKVYVASACEDKWADPKNEYLGCIAADEFFKEQGASGFIHPERLPDIGDCFNKGNIGYHLRAGTHFLSREDWNRYIKYAK